MRNIYLVPDGSTFRQLTRKRDAKRFARENAGSRCLVWFSEYDANRTKEVKRYWFDGRKWSK